MVELLVSFFLIALVCAGLYRILIGNITSAKVQQEISRQFREFQRLKQSLEDDIAEAGFDPKNALLYPIQSASATTLRLQADFNVDDAIEVTEYIYDTASHRVTRNGLPFLTDVTSFSFCYLDDPEDPCLAFSGPGETLTDFERKRVNWVRTEWTPMSSQTKVERKGFEVMFRNAH